MIYNIYDDNNSKSDNNSNNDNDNNNNMNDSYCGASLYCTWRIPTPTCQFSI